MSSKAPSEPFFALHRTGNAWQLERLWTVIGGVFLLITCMYAPIHRGSLKHGVCLYCMTSCTSFNRIWPFNLVGWGRDNIKLIYMIWQTRFETEVFFHRHTKRQLHFWGLANHPLSEPDSKYCLFMCQLYAYLYMLIYMCSVAMVRKCGSLWNG